MNKRTLRALAAAFTALAVSALVENSKRVRVSWNYVGVNDRVKKLYSSGWRTIRCPSISERYNIKFRVSGHDKSGYILYPSPIVWYTTVG